LARIGFGYESVSIQAEISIPSSIGVQPNIRVPSDIGISSKDRISSSPKLPPNIGIPGRIRASIRIPVMIRDGIRIPVGIRPSIRILVRIPSCIRVLPGVRIFHGVRGWATPTPADAPHRGNWAWDSARPHPLRLPNCLI